MSHSQLNKLSGEMIFCWCLIAVWHIDIYIVFSDDDGDGQIDEDLAAEARGKPVLLFFYLFHFILFYFFLILFLDVYRALAWTSSEAC